MARRTHAFAAALAGDSQTQGGALLPVSSVKAQLHQLARAQLLSHRLDQSGRQAAFAQFQRNGQLLAEAAQPCFLRTREGSMVHDRR